MKLIGIYGLQNKLKPDKWYIGGSVNIISRWNKYKNALCVSQPKLYRALKKYGHDGFEKYIIELCNPNTSEDLLNKKEVMWIKHYNSYHNGYNCTEDGTIRMLVRTKEHNRKIGDANRGKPTWSKGKKHTKEHNIKVSVALAGIKRGPQSEQQKKNTSEIMKQYFRDNPRKSPT